MATSPARLWGAALVVLLAASACGEPAQPPTTPPVEISTVPRATATPDATPATPVAPTSSITSTSTSTSTSVPTSTSASTAATIIGPSDLAASWIGVEFTVTTTDPLLEGVEILANLGLRSVEFLVGDEPAGVFGWHVGYTHHAMTGPRFYVVVVGSEPNPYSWDGEAPEPLERDPEVVHDLMVWAISEQTPTSFLITDVMEIRLPAITLGYQDLMAVSQEPWWCEIDPSLRTSVLFAYFDRSREPEIGRHYPAILAFAVESGTLSPVRPEMVSCVLAVDDQ